jgi:hypothetical protein
MDKDQEFSPESLREWERDKRGEPFFEELRRLFAKGIAEVREASRKGDAVQTAYYTGKTDVVEEVLQLVDIIIQEKQEEKGEKK